MSSLLAGAVHINLTADALGFTQGIDKAEKSLNSLDKGATSSGGGLNSLGNIAQVAIGNVLAGAFTTATTAAKNFFDSQMDGAKDFEVTRIAFDGIIANTEKAGQIMDQVVKNAAATPFEIPELAESAKMLAAFGVAADDVIPSIMMVGDVSAGLNVPIQEMAYLVGTIKSSGKAMTADLNQFANRGVPIWQALEKVTGKNNAQLRDMAQNGEITYELIEKGFKSMTSEGGAFNGMMERISGTGKGLDSTLSDTFGSIGRRIIGMTDKGEVVTGGLFERIKKATTETIGFLNQPAIIGFAENIGKGLGSIFDAIGEGKNLANSILPVTFEYLKSIYKIGKYLFTGDFQGGIFGMNEDDPFMLFLYSLRENFIYFANNIIPLLIRKSWEFTNFWMTTIAPILLNFYANVWLKISKGIMDFANLALPYVVSMIKWFADSWTTILIPGIMLFWEALQPLIKNIIDIIVMITPYVMPFLSALVDYFLNYFAPLIGSSMQLVAVVAGIVILGIIKLLTKLTEDIKWFVTMAIGFFNYFGVSIRSIFVGITQSLTGFINVIVGIFTGNGDKVREGFLGMFNGLGNLVKGIFEGIVGIIRLALNNIFIDPFNRIIDNIPSEVGGISVPKPGKIPRFSRGVENFGGGMAYVHAGELLTNLPRGTNVHTKAETQSMLGSNQRPVSIEINIGNLLGTAKDRREFLSTIENELIAKITPLLNT
jgi:tape measure domain-containing protein